MIDPQLIQDIIAWQRFQFPEATGEGSTAHLHNERSEAVDEVADMAFMLIQASDRGGYDEEDRRKVLSLMFAATILLGCEPTDLEEAMRAKLEENRQRKWPAKPNSDGCYFHSKEPS